MFSDTIICGIRNGESNDEIVATIEALCHTTISGSTRAHIEEDIDWYRSNPFYNPELCLSEASKRPHKTAEF